MQTPHAAQSPFCLSQPTPEKLKHPLNLAKLLIGFIIVAASSLFAAEQQALIPKGWDWRTTITVPRLPKALALDGNLSAAEWEYATAVDLLHDEVTGIQARCAAGFLFGYDGKDLCIGYHMTRPNGSGEPLSVIKTPGYSEIPIWCKNDTVEVWLAPFTEDVKPSGMMEPAYCIVVNGAGAYSHHLTGWERKEVPRDLGYGASVKGTEWSGEIKIPFSTLALIKAPQPKIPPAKGVEWAASVFYQTITPGNALISPQTFIGGYENVIPYIHLRFSDEPVGFYISAVEPVGEDKGAFAAEVRNGSNQTVDYELQYEIFRRNQIPRSLSEQFLTTWHWLYRVRAVGKDKAGAELAGILDPKSEEELLAGLNKSYTWADGGSRPLKAEAGKKTRAEISFNAPDGYYLVGYRIVNKQTGEIAMQQVAPTLLARLPLQVRPEFLQKKKIVVRAGTGMVKGIAPGDMLKVRLLDSSRKIVEEQALPIDPAIFENTVMLSSDKTREGEDYLVETVVERPADQKILAKNSEKIHRPKNPEWFGLNLGKTDQVPPGFQPLKQIDKGFELALRKYILDGSVFPAMIEIRGDPFLAAPISLMAKVQGKEVSFKKSSLEVTRASPTEAEFRQKWEGAGLQLDIKGKLEYDGFIHYDVEASGSSVSLESLVFQIPVVAKHAPWFGFPSLSRSLGTCLGSAPTKPGYYTRGNLERFFKFYPDGLMPFVWDLYLGGPDRGIEWLAESDRNWSPKDENKMMGLVQEKDRVTMQARLVDSPVTLTQPRQFSFAINTAPVRDLSEEQYYSMTRAPYGIYMAAPEDFRKDAKIAELFRTEKDLGVRWQSFYVNLGPELFSNIRFYEEKHLSRVRSAGALAHANGMKTIFYCGYSLPPGIPENETFGNEMRMEPSWRGWYYHAGPFADYWLHSAKFMVENAEMDAFHTDGLADVILVTNPTYDYGWLRDGKLHGTYPVFAVRDLFKRFYHMLKFEIKGGKIGYHWPHLEATPIFSIEAFSDNSVSGEEYYENMATLSELPLDVYRIAQDTLPLGTLRMNIWMTWRSDIPVTVSMINTLHVLHGNTIPYWGLPYDGHPYEAGSASKPEAVMWRNFGREKSHLLPYWKHPDLAQVTPDAKGMEIGKETVKVSGYVRQDNQSAVLIVANLSNYGYTLRVRPNPAALGLKGKASDYNYTDPILGSYHYPVIGEEELRVDIYAQRWRAILMQKKNK